ncbi:hypothetical protein [Pseudonocardia sp. HH130630-07]|uniref:hypothetical protein n=1 Tax=Pseudonocardia sp. HH130630-07 TaxID=1690815 RepID=UPI0008150158|nr:hypothetical protein [Pseudonocardia sp. HH130630-07]ANY09631.1 hypothetical protein AFB00_29175 [Pseudonocardia sp. HH130630-07]
MTTPPNPQQPNVARPGEAWPSGSPDPLVTRGVAGWFDRVGDVLRRTWAPLAGLYLGALAVVTLVTVVAGLVAGGTGPGMGYDASGGMTRELGTTSIGLVLLVELLVIAVSVPVLLTAAGASFHLVLQRAAGREATVAAAVRFAWRRLPSALLWAVPAALLLVAGLLVLVLPGIYLAVALSPLVGVLFVERGTLGRVFALSHQSFGTTLGRCALLGVVNLVALIVPFIVLGVANVGSGSFLATALSLVVTLPSCVLWTAASSVTYAELRGIERPGTTVYALADELR